MLNSPGTFAHTRTIVSAASHVQPTGNKGGDPDSAKQTGSLLVSGVEGQPTHFQKARLRSKFPMFTQDLCYLFARTHLVECYGLAMAACGSSWGGLGPAGSHPVHSAKGRAPKKEIPSARICWIACSSAGEYEKG